MAETPSFSVKPSATPIAKIRGRRRSRHRITSAARCDRISGITAATGSPTAPQRHRARCNIHVQKPESASSDPAERRRRYPAAGPRPAARRPAASGTCRSSEGRRSGGSLGWRHQPSVSSMMRSVSWSTAPLFREGAPARRTCSAVPSASTVGQLLAFGQGEPADRGLDRRDRRDGDGKLLDAEPDQDRDREQVGRDAAADADPFAVLLAPSSAARSSAARPGAGRRPAGQLGVAPVHRQGVLGQVVGADREEVALGGECRP